LHLIRVQRFALKLEQVEKKCLTLYPSGFNLTSRMHHEGLNIHLLGLVRMALFKAECIALVTSEMLARIGKNMVRQRIRQRSKQLQNVSDVSGREVVAEVFTEILCDMSQEDYDFRQRYAREITSSDIFWSTSIKQYAQEMFFDQSILYFQTSHTKDNAVEEFVFQAKKTLERSMVLERLLSLLD